MMPCAAKAIATSSIVLLEDAAIARPRATKMNHCAQTSEPSSRICTAVRADFVRCSASESVNPLFDHIVSRRDPHRNQSPGDK
jgi:hypothetical protein